MALEQVGTAALRSPTGEFLPSVPILREISEESTVKEKTMSEVESLFVERMKQYAKACEKSKKHDKFT